MKTNRIILTVILGLFIGLYSCDEEMSNNLSQTDLAALNGLRDAHANAFNENEDLKSSLLKSNSAGIHLHDSLFHHFEDLFEEHHSNYSHENTHDDHRHDGQGMHMGDNAIGSHSYEDGHHENDHDMMDDLEIDHESVFH
jgi:hypothetical protein